MRSILAQLLLPFLILSPLYTLDAQPIEVIWPEIVIQDVEYKIPIEIKTSDTPQQSIKLNDKQYQIIEEDGQHYFTYQFDASPTIKVSYLDQGFEKKDIHPIPLWLSLIPPLLAIFLALIIREVITSLILGIFVGACIIMVYQEGFWGLLLGFLAMMDTYILEALNDGGHLSIIVFSTLIGGMVSIISKNGGMQGVVNRISKYASDAKSGQFATWFLGIAIFFDDYANTLIVGNTMRPVSDRLKISREKLAYLVDSTAAPMASIAFITTWIGAELGYISSGIESIPAIKEGVYSIFINSLAYSFYPIFALIFMLILIWRGKDFGPMLIAERKARTKEDNDPVKNIVISEDEFVAKEGIPHQAFHAILPVLVVILGTIVGLLYTGYDQNIWTDQSLSFSRKLSATIGNADSYLALLWSSAAGLITAIKLSVFDKKLKLQEAISASLTGFKTMLPAIVILILAWALAAVIEDLHTADLLTSLLSDSLSAPFIPAFTFLLAAIVAFSTGSSWGTMAILYPLMLPASWQISMEAGLDFETAMSIFYNVVACVLAGAVLGDHCSPISDTTILSSLASSCNHIEHVRTQLPYALTVGLIAVLIGIIPTGYGLSAWICFPLGIIALYGLIELLGKKVI